jgi:tetratricopeptide (TPR) repeat protein
MRHLAFFNELTSLDDSGDDWRAVSAGLVLLRLIDTWIDEGPKAAAKDGWSVRGVRGVIDEMPAGLPARAILASTLDAIVDAETVDMHTVSPRLMAYARSLDSDAKFALAADVYETVIAYSHPTEEADTTVTAHVRLSYCRRQLGELNEAEQIAIQAGRIARAVGDLIGELRGRIAEAKVSMARGNYPRAEEMLDSTIRDAKEAGLAAFHADALQERAGVAQLKGEYEFAIKLGYEALDKLTDERSRDRMLGDIAAAFYSLGIRSAARDAWTLLSVTAQEQYVRWTSRINLMEIASVEGLLSLFEKHLRQLEDARMPPMLRAQFLLHTGEGYARLGKREQARDHLTESMALAAQYGYNRLVFYAEEQLESVERHVADVQPEPPIPETLVPIADALRDRHVGVIALR